ncbi:hypothetical protein K469DRAFT_584947 [Zopfia rhizophila CBS 207.26]|uniref:Uncharacterized protein n=1 Tax=Zopfia rhizophila CBS 207.26 TaxID=1314779 RepID=A0A6A6DTG9_9PEZI|nr:hypothetical protein K469DRAFT_584947 [Zopfia rhizophila CBS 207.26]
MRQTFTLLFPITLLSPSILAAVNGPCSNGADINGICIDRGRCINTYHGHSDPGRPGAWSCPGTPNNIECCSIVPCPTFNSQDFGCTWRSRCQNLGFIPVCPGGNDFVCCEER